MYLLILEKKQTFLMLMLQKIIANTIIKAVVTSGSRIVRKKLELLVLLERIEPLVLLGLSQTKTKDISVPSTEVERL